MPVVILGAGRIAETRESGFGAGRCTAAVHLERFSAHPRKEGLPCVDTSRVDVERPVHEQMGGDRDAALRRK